MFEAVSAFIGTHTQSGVDNWYANLTAPPFTPPNIIFPIMWSILYAMIAAAGWTIWRRRHSDNGMRLLTLFGVYMAFNWSWSFVFFGAQQLFAGFIWIIIINIIACLIIAISWHKMRAAALLMIPPTFWTLYAAYLNGGYWILN